MQPPNGSVSDMTFNADTTTQAAPTQAAQAELAWSAADTSPAVAPYTARWYHRKYPHTGNPWPAGMLVIVALAGAGLIGLALWHDQRPPARQVQGATAPASQGQPQIGPFPVPTEVATPTAPAAPPVAQPPAPAPTAPALTPRPALSPADAVYLHLLSMDGLPQSPAGDADRIATGHIICNYIAGSGTQNEEVGIVQKSLEWPRADAAALVSDAMIAYCPALMGAR